MKKIFNILLCLSMVLITCFTFAGCNPKDTTDDDTNTPAVINFYDVFWYSYSKAYSGNTYNFIENTDNSNFACFEYNEIEANTDISLSQISFDIQSESVQGENLYVSIYTTIEGTTKVSCVSEQLSISNTPTTVEFYFIQYQTGGKGFRTSIPSNGTETKTTLTKNTKFYIYYGTGTEFKDLNNNLYAVGEYSNAINISNFTIK